MLLISGDDKRNVCEGPPSDDCQTLQVSGGDVALALFLEAGLFALEFLAAGFILFVGEAGFDHLRFELELALVAGHLVGVDGGVALGKEGFSAVGMEFHFYVGLGHFLEDLVLLLPAGCWSGGAWSRSFHYYDV
ncbi:hypothetical protein ACHAW6_001190 [Cyclotella cf. meneghiniana]